MGQTQGVEGVFGPRHMATLLTHKRAQRGYIIKPINKYIYVHIYKHIYKHIYINIYIYML